jgi:hypothetical protein
MLTSSILGVIPCRPCYGRMSRTQRSVHHDNPSHREVSLHRTSAALTLEGPRGRITYQRLFLLYRVYALVLWRRYAASCQGQLEALDRALASVMGRQEELVRKLRQRLGRALRAVN